MTGGASRRVQAFIQHFDQALTVVASGFFDPSMNSNGAAFGLHVALAAGGTLVELPVFVSVKDPALEQAMTVFPNPASDQIRVALANDVRADEMQLVDLQGRVIVLEAP